MPLIAALAFVALRAVPAVAAGSSLPHNEGGYVPEFVKIVRAYNASGEPFRIEGTCKSACTLFLGIRNVCIVRSATLMFHGGHDIAENRTGPDTRASRGSTAVMTSPRTAPARIPGRAAGVSTATTTP